MGEVEWWFGYGCLLADCGGLYSGAIRISLRSYYGGLSELAYEVYMMYTINAPQGPSSYLQYPHRILQLQHQIRPRPVFPSNLPFDLRMRVGRPSGW